MKKKDLIFLAKLRLLVGYLGEQNQFAWWPSSFLAPSSKAFLAPVFGKTFFLAQYHGVKEAATKVHDDYIGIGRSVFHLFRLPEAVEQELQVLLCDSETVEQLIRELSSKKDALNALEICGKSNGSAAGPVRIGGLNSINRKDIWQVAARYYKHSFETNNKVFPFLSEGQ